MVTVDDLAEFLGFAAVPTDTESLNRALATARGIIYPHLKTTTLTGDAESVLDSATLTVAADEWRRKDTGGGTYAFADGTDFVARLPYDQLQLVWPKLVAAGLVSIVVA